MSGTNLRKLILDDVTPDAFDDVDVQYPLPTDSDSVYAKDVWEGASVTTGWVEFGSTTGLDPSIIPFTNLHTVIKYSGADNPKVLLIHFNRTVSLSQVSLGAHTGDFSNVKLELLGSALAVRDTVDLSGDSTKLTSLRIPFEPQLTNAIRLSFYTADDVSLSNITIQKTIVVAAQIQGIKPDGTLTAINATAGGNLKVSLEELENQISVNGNSQLRTTLYDELGIPASVDDSTETLQVIDYEHHEIHSGSHYEITEYVDLPISNVRDLQIVTPNTTKWGHLILAITCESETEWFLYEGVTINTPGTLHTAYNNNRNSLNTADITVAYIDNTSVANANADTDPAASTTLKNCIIGAGRDGGFAARRQEIILKQNTSYSVRFVANTAGYVCYDLEWYEHIDKN